MPSEIAINLGPALVERLFPFLLAIDERLRVQKLGRGVRKICANAEPGVALLDILTIIILGSGVYLWLKRPAFRRSEVSGIVDELEEARA